MFDSFKHLFLRVYQKNNALFLYNNFFHENEALFKRLKSESSTTMCPFHINERCIGNFPVWICTKIYVSIIQPKNYIPQSVNKYWETTNVGVLLELGLTPIYLSAIKFSVKNWERIRKGHANEMLKSAFSEASSTNLPWTNGIKSILEVLGMPNYYSDDNLNKPNFI